MDETRTTQAMAEDDRLVRTAALVASLAHRGQTDDGGRPYFEHPKAVAQMLSTPTLKAIAYLHDVLEDTAVRKEDLIAVFPEEVAQTVILLTHAVDEPYDQYISRIAENDLARQVKIADLTHNMDLSRLTEITPYALERLEEKYKPAYEYLKRCQETARIREEALGPRP